MFPSSVVIKRIILHRTIKILNISIIISFIACITIITIIIIINEMISNNTHIHKEVWLY